MSFWNRKREEKVEKYKEIPFQHLAPIDSVDDKTTFDALDYALSQTNIHNIALTGNYGSGKSSILESYIKRNKSCWLIECFFKLLSKAPLLSRLIKGKKWFLKISLATFAVEDKEDYNLPQKENRSFSEAVLQKIEKSILQQILYRKSGAKLPNSRFIRIKRTNKIDAFVTAFVVLALFIVSNYFIQGEIWEYICKPFTLPLVWSDIALSASVLLALFLFLYKLLIFVKKLRIAKLCFSNAEIEFKGNESEESLLNKYLDELLYFFEVTGYNVIIFEDLDRFNNTEIFIKLRELNTLLNNYENIHHKIVFIYALRDEVFTDSSRTKFFDFIVPVIPVINSQNSSDMLLNQWKENKDSPLGKIDESFLQDIGLYIDDMRLLKNSINEFKIYDKKVNREDYKSNNNTSDEKICRDRNKIFALILYKNLYPNDFALLAQDDGDLYSIIQKRNTIAKEECKQIELEIKNLENKIQEIDRQIDFDIKELRIIYISKIFSKKPDNSFISLNADDFTSDEEFDKIKKDSSLVCLQYAQRSGYYSNWSYEKSPFSYNFVNIENEVDSKHSYNKREEMIKSKVNGELIFLRNNLKEKNFDLSECRKKNIKELLETVSPEKFTGHLEKQNEKFNNFVIYLLRHGYIDENYSEYISNFYANSLSPHEIQYLLLIKNQQSPNFELILTNVNNVINRIKDIEWKLPAVLNDSMLSYLLITDDCHLKDFLGALWNFKLVSHDDFFLSKYSADSNCLSRLYQDLYKFLGHQSNWINIIFDNENIGILYYFFIYVDFEKTEENILSYLKRDISFLHLDNIDKKTVSSKIDHYGLKFNLLEDTIKYPVYNIILDNDAYVLSKYNFDIIIKNAFGDTAKEPIKDYYTQISKLENQNVKTYVDQNIEAFVRDVILSTGDLIAESEDAFVELLNNNTLLTETKVELIEKNDCVISDIAKIKIVEVKLADANEKFVDIRNLLFKHKKVSPTWSNVFENFKYNGNKLDPCLVEYLNDEQIVNKLIEYKPLADDEIEENNGNHEVASNFYGAVLTSHDMSLSSFAKLMTVCPWCYNELNQYEIDSGKMNKIIELEKISLSSKNYSGIKQNHPSLLSKFISNNFDEFINKWSELKIVINSDGMKLLLDSDDLSREQKCQLLSTDFEIWHNISQKNSFIWLGKKIIELEFTGKIIVPIKRIFENLDDETDIIGMIALQAENLDEADMVNAINNKTNDDYKSSVKREGRKVKIPNTVQNKKLCAKLEEKGIISSFKEDGDKLKIYQKKS